LCVGDTGGHEGVDLGPPGVDGAGEGEQLDAPGQEPVQPVAGQVRIAADPHGGQQSAPLVTCLPRLSRSSLGLSDHQCPATTTDMAKATPTPISVVDEFHRLGDVYAQQPNRKRLSDTRSGAVSGGL
jgi:hypothetical protein